MRLHRVWGHHCLFLKTDREGSNRRNQSLTNKKSHMQPHSRSFMFSVRRTLPDVHWLTVIISQTQMPASDTQINSLHRHFSALLSENSNSTLRQPFPSPSEDHFSFEDFEDQLKKCNNYQIAIFSFRFHKMTCIWIREYHIMHSWILWLTECYWQNKCRSRTIKTHSFQVYIYIFYSFVQFIHSINQCPFSFILSYFVWF